MSEQKLQNLIEASQSLTQKEKLSLAKILLSDISNNKIIFVSLPDSPIDPPVLDINAVRAAQGLANKY